MSRDYTIECTDARMTVQGAIPMDDLHRIVEFAKASGFERFLVNDGRLIFRRERDADGDRAAETLALHTGLSLEMAQSTVDLIKDSTPAPYSVVPLKTTLVSHPHPDVTPEDLSAGGRPGIVQMDVEQATRENFWRKQREAEDREAPHRSSLEERIAGSAPMPPEPEKSEEPEQSV